MNDKTRERIRLRREKPIVQDNSEPVIDANPIDMNKVVGTHDILFVCFDTLRWDVAYREQENGGTPVLNSYGGKWEKCGASGNFTYPAHHAMFIGFLPSPIVPTTSSSRRMLFLPKYVGMSKGNRPNAFTFDGPTFIQGLSKEGYKTICIGGVSYFDNRSDIGKTFPSYFNKAYWRPSFGCTVKESVDNQINFAVKKIAESPAEQRIFMYINICAIHYPNYFYLDGATVDSVETHAAALRYVDARIGKLFEAFKNRGKTFVIACSDHGSCYGEDGYESHCFNHEIVNTVPYKNFFL